MPAKYYPSPIGNMPIRDHIIKEMANKTDREIADKVFDSPFIDPEYYAELMSRGLSGPGVFKEVTYKRIKDRENTKRSVCCVCGTNWVDVDAGFDTCDSCLNNI